MKGNLFNGLRKAEQAIRTTSLPWIVKTAKHLLLAQF